jgi:elongation factor 2
VLCGEEVRNFRVNLVDCELHTDAIHRGAGQIIPAARRLFYACQIASKPTLIQPIYQITIKSP